MGEFVLLDFGYNFHPFDEYFQICRYIRLIIKSNLS